MRAFATMRAFDTMRTIVLWFHCATMPILEYNAGRSYASAHNVSFVHHAWGDGA